MCFLSTSYILPFIFSRKSVEGGEGAGEDGKDAEDDTMLGNQLNSSHGY